MTENHTGKRHCLLDAAVQLWRQGQALSAMTVQQLAQAADRLGYAVEAHAHKVSPVLLRVLGNDHRAAALHSAVSVRALVFHRYGLARVRLNVERDVILGVYITAVDLRDQIPG